MQENDTVESRNAFRKRIDCFRFFLIFSIFAALNFDFLYLYFVFCILYFVFCPSSLSSSPLVCSKKKLFPQPKMEVSHFSMTISQTTTFKELGLG